MSNENNSSSKFVDILKAGLSNNFIIVLALIGAFAMVFFGNEDISESGRTILFFIIGFSLPSLLRK